MVVEQLRHVTQQEADEWVKKVNSVFCPGQTGSALQSPQDLPTKKALWKHVGAEFGIQAPASTDSVSMLA